MSFPRSIKDARARSRRKLKALEKRFHKDLLDIAGFFDEGPVSSDIDQLMIDLKAGVEAITASIDDEVLRDAEREEWS